MTTTPNNSKKTNGLHDDLANFEKGRIKQLQDERLSIQKKTFTKWMNSFLLKQRMEVADLFKDLADGTKLLKLLEIISGEKLGKPNSGKMRVHHVENVNKSLAFLHTKVRLESIGAEDIVDGNPRLILGLIWTIILRFQIQEIEIDVDEDNHESSEKKSAKDALLLWCQRKTAGYPNVAINDFTGSWRTGLGFNALIHAHRPDLINFPSLTPTKHIDNLNNAFDAAEGGLGIPRLLDAEDIDTAKPDEKSILTYVASYYHTFARMKNELKGGRRIANIIHQIMEAESLQHNYELATTSLLNWITMTTRKFESLPLPSNVQLVQTALADFKNYRTTEKPPKYKEKSEIEASFFNINIRLKELNQNSYAPPDGRLLHDVEKLWEGLEKAENRLERRLKEELLRQRGLEGVALKFWKKAELREGYLRDMVQVLSDPRYGIPHPLIDLSPTLKKHEAISADILAREPRCKQLSQMSDYLTREKYHAAAEIAAKSGAILQTWSELLALLSKHKSNLAKFNEINNKKNEAENFLEDILNFSKTFSPSKSRNLGEAEDLLSRLNLNEVSMANLGGKLDRIKKSVSDEELGGLGGEMVSAHAQLLKDCKEYRGRLEEELAHFRAAADLEEEEEWVEEKRRIVGGMRLGEVKDLRGVVRSGGKLKSLLEEIKIRSEKLTKLTETCTELGLSTSELDKNLVALTTQIRHKQSKLKNLELTFTHLQDCNEIGDWINEMRPLMASGDFGEDVPSATALLKRHLDLRSEMESFSGDVGSLEGLELGGVGGSDEEDEIIYTQEQRLVPVDYVEECVVERTEYKTVTEERPVPQVRALYPFNGQDGLDVGKGEIMFLLSRTNGDWWNVRKSSGVDGFVPANYVKEIEPKVVLVQVRKPEVVKETTQLKKTKMVMQSFNVQKVQKNVNLEGKNLEGRISQVVEGYRELVVLGESRTASLTASIALFTFLSECEDFEKYLLEKHRQLTDTNLDSGEVSLAKKKFDQLVTDLSSSPKRLAALDAMATELAAFPQTKPRQKQIHKLYQELNNLRNEKETSLAGASIVQLFHRNVGELEDWILEKQEQLEHAFGVNDLKTVQALQRRHLNIERELVPIKEKLGVVEGLATSASAQYPRERPLIQKSLQKCHALFSTLLQKSASRRSRLDHAVGKEIFSSSFKNLLEFKETMETAFTSHNHIPDVSTAEDLLKKHESLLDELKNKDDEFSQVIALGKELTKIDPNIESQILTLETVALSLPEKWAEKNSLLQQILDYKMFEKEADIIDRQINLSPVVLATNLEQVEQQLKRQVLLENALVAGEDRLQLFISMATKLGKIHNQSEKISARTNQVIAARTELKKTAESRRTQLQRNLRYHEFASETGDMLAWVEEKKAVVNSDDYKDLANLEKKLKKHAVFSGELKSNESKLKSLNKFGQKLITTENNPDNVDKLLCQLNSAWAELSELCAVKFKNLKQAEAQMDYNKSVEGVAVKLAELEKELNSKELGKDRRACKELLRKHELTEAELGNCGRRIEELIKLGEELKAEGHWDGDRIVSMATQLQEQLERLFLPAKKRREALEELLKFYDFLFDLESELGYIKEKEGVLVALATLPSGLHEAGVRVKKASKFSQECKNHSSVIDKVLALGVGMVTEAHPEKKKIRSACSELESAWASLLALTAEKTLRLEYSLKAHQYYNDAGEVESWIGERTLLLSSPSLGSSASSSILLLTSHKTIELEIDTYSSLIHEMFHLISKSNPEHPAMVAKQHDIQAQMEKLQLLANEKRNKLINTMNKHEFYAESGDFLAWIEEMVGLVGSEEYGADWEHLERIRGKFQGTREKVMASEGRLRGLGELVGRLPEGERGEGEGEVGRVGTRHAFLLSALSARELKLAAAGEIHRFNRDVADALERINEKMSEIPENSGKDLNSCQLGLRNMENFENDLVPLEAQLQILINTSTTLSSLYPTNAPNIAEEQALVIANWSALQRKTEATKAALQSSLDYYKFISCHRDLSNWGSSLLKQLAKLEPASDGQLAMTEHEQTKISMDSRSEKYDALASLASILQNTDQAEEIQHKLTSTLTLRESLASAWDKKKTYLDQLIDLQIFQRDSKSLQSILHGQELALHSVTNSNSVEELEKVLKKHGELENLMKLQDGKFEMLEGRKLVEQGHFDSSSVLATIQEITARRGELLLLALSKRADLEKKLAYAKFSRDVQECLIYLEEKQKQLENLNRDTSNLEEKIKKLKKHQAFEAELRRGNVAMVIEQAQAQDSQLYQELKEKYTKLLDYSSLCGRGLEEAQDILDFINEVEKLEEWMRVREGLVTSNDLGKDFEHCEELLWRLEMDKLGQEDVGVSRVGELGGRLGPGEHLERLSRVNKRWEGLEEGLRGYRRRLEVALETHRFEKEVDEVEQRIRGLIGVMGEGEGKLAGGTGRDLEGVEKLMRRQGEILNQLKQLSTRITELETMATNTNPTLIATKITPPWTTLLSLSSTTTTTLSDALSYQKFLKKLSELENYTENCIAKLRSSPLPQNLPQAQELQEEQVGFKQEIHAKLSQFVALETELNKCYENHQYGQELSNCLELLGNLKEKLGVAMETRDKVLDQGVKLQNFNQISTEADNLLNELDSVINHWLGEDIEQITKMLVLHKESERLASRCAAKTMETGQFGNKLINQEHYAGDVIREKMSKLDKKLEQLTKNHGNKTKQLQDLRDFKKFLASLTQVENYLKEKITIATDDNYSDQTNLQSKMQKHQAFESEIGAYTENRVGQLVNEGRGLIHNHNLHGDDIKTRLTELESLAGALRTASHKKRDLLYESYQALLFFNNLDDLESFLDEPNFEESGENLSSVKYLLKKWLQIKENYEAKGEVQVQLKRNNATFQKNFMKEEINGKVAMVFDKFDEFGHKLSNKLDQLRADLAKFEYLRDVEELMDFVQEKSAQVNSLELGSSVEQVNKLVKKLELIKEEVDSHRVVMTTLDHSGLDKEFKQLEGQVEQKHSLLAQSLSSHLLYAQIADAENYIKEKTQIFTSSDVGVDEESVAKLVKKFDSSYTNLNAFKSVVMEITAQASKLGSNFDAEKIAATSASLLSSFSSLQLLADKRKLRLDDASKLFKYLAESAELVEWIEAQVHIAGSEDYGRDVEHVEILMQKFDAFLTAVLNTGENRVEHVGGVARQLIEVKHPEEGLISQKLGEVKGVWEEFKELAGARSDALEGAKRVHSFDRNADETIGWVGGKVGELGGVDSVEVLELERGVVEEAVGGVVKEGRELVGMFPDAEEHLEAKLGETFEISQLFQSTLSSRKSTLIAMETIREYFTKYDELLSYLLATHSRITITTVVEGVEPAEWNLQKLQEIQSEYEGKLPEFTAFIKTGRDFIVQNHSLSPSIESKLTVLEEKMSHLKITMETRTELLEQNLDLQKFYRDVNNFESVLKSKEMQIAGEEKEYVSIATIEENLREFEDLELFLEVIGGKLGVVERRTLVEVGVARMRERERKLGEEEERRRRVGEEVRKQQQEKQTSGGGGGWGLFGDVLRRGSDPVSITITPDPAIPRSSSFRTTPTDPSAGAGAGPKKPRRTPSFTTRRRTQSFRKVKTVEDPSRLPPITLDGYLERKHEFGCHGKRATNRSWKSYYTVLCGQLLCFFKDQEDFLEARNAAASPVNVFGCVVEVAGDYVKKRFVFRIKIFDGGEYLFACESEVAMEEWVEKLGVVGKLEPREQLVFFEHKSGNDGDQSSSEDEVKFPKTKNKPRSREPLYANVSLEEHTATRAKPPIPPRSSSINKLEGDAADGAARHHDNHFRPLNFHPPAPPPKPAVNTALLRNNPYHSVYVAGTLPPSTTAPGNSNNGNDFLQPRSSGSLPSKQPSHHHDNNSSSESDSPKSGKNSQSKKSSTGLMGLFKRKKATNL